ncbi:MAG: DUF1574 domain-containing protein [Gemmataceae bacterium]|nr:DUF1574 domain-containing protein [Gemmataceae bacterium]MDW8266042.1 DUF1574 family protein [Gemmataceae bacterium]
MSRRPGRRHGLHRRCRCSLAWAAAIAIGLQAGLAVTLDRGLVVLRNGPFHDKYQRLCQRLEGAARAEPLASRGPWRAGVPEPVLILGSSRSAYGFRSGVMEERLAAETGRPVVVYNFSMYGAGPTMHLLNLRRLVQRGVRPSVVLVEVLPPLLGGSGPEPTEGRWLYTHRLDRDDLLTLEAIGFPTEPRWPVWRWSFWVPWYTQRFAILSRLYPTLLPWSCREDWALDTDAWGDSHLVASALATRRDEAIGRTYGEYHALLSDFQLHAVSVAALRAILGLCREEGISVALVLMPEGPAFRSWYPASAWAAIQAMLSEVQRDYGVPVVSTRDWLTEEDFLDSHHILPSSAQRFSDRFVREALLPAFYRY